MTLGSTALAADLGTDLLAPREREADDNEHGGKHASQDKLLLSWRCKGAGVGAIPIVGVGIKIGIEPTVRHAGNLGFIPVVVTD